MAPTTTIIGSSLPPMVEGQLRCFLSIKLGDLEWSIPRPPKDIQVRILWWGQAGNGAVLRPQVDTDPNYVVSKNKHAEVHYPVRCGPRQFESYLKDMSGLHLDVIFGPSCTSFASVNITDIGLLSSTQILDSYYPLMCTTAAYQRKEVGRLKVTVSFKTISDTYNVSSSIIPTTDKEFQQPDILKDKDKDKDAKKKITFHTGKQLQKKVPVKNKKQVTISSKPANKSAEQHVNKDISFIVGPGAHTSQHANKDSSRLEILPSNTKSDEEESDEDIAEPFVTRNTDHVPSHRISSPPGGSITHQQPIILRGEQRASILSSLLHKTQNLRNSMIKHTLHSDNVPLKSETRSHAKSSGVLIKELLRDEKYGHGSHGDINFAADDSMDTAKCSAAHEMDKLDMKVVDLLLGKEDNIEQLLKRVDISVDSNFSNYSDDQDPLHDSSLLDELLYTTKAMQNLNESSILSLDESSREDLNIKKANKIMQLNKKIFDDSCDLIPTKEKQESANDAADKEECIDEEYNDNSNMSTPMQSEDSHTVYKKHLPESITVEKLTQLGRVKSAKVICKEFSLCVESLNYGLVYFVEYKFPVSTEENQCASMEHVRHVSRHVNSIVDFGRFSVFPILFNEEMVEFWWQNYVSFKLHVKYERQEKAEWFGEGYFKLRDVLLNKEFKINAVIDIYNDARDHTSNHKSYSPIGQLKLYVELTMEHSKTLSSRSSKCTSLPSAITIPSEPKQEKQESCTNQLTPIKINTKFKKKPVVELKVKDKKHMDQPIEEVAVNVFLHNLIAVSGGKDIVYSTKNDECHFCNSYFVCRVFWNNGELKSKICWSTDNPNYGFQQIIPVTLNTITISKMENNFMIIEVWHKSTTTDRDKLIGMSKLSLHQFFLSFKDPKLADTILKSKYPVIAYDGSVPVVNLFSGKEHGCLNVLFALGTHDQVMQVLQMKNARQSRNLDLERRNGRDMSLNDDLRNCDEGMVDHHFEVTIENVKGLAQDNDEVWGEADCYIQYHFPEQNKCRELKMANFKTKTTLCLPNPVFHHSTTHSFSMEKDVPLQRLLLECFKTTSSDVTFEMWKRHYYPNVRDQLIAKASLPLAKLCAMITMHDGSDSNQSFHLPLVSHVDRNEIGESSNGMLDVFMRYKLRSSERNNQLPKQLVCLSVSINRLCGLKDGLCWLTKKYKKLNHAARTGPNIFVRLYLSFVGKTSIRTTNVTAKSYSPSFSYHVDFPLPLTFGNEKQTSLAEMLEDGCIICDVMHEFMEVEEEDILIGVVKIPLIDVLTHATGVKGWWALKVPNINGRECEDEKNAGGIEVNAKFTNNTDREQIVNIGRGMGWSPNTDLGLQDEAWFSTANDSGCKPSLLNLYVDIIMMPVNVVDGLLCKYADVKHRFETMYCRYKFYNKAPIYSKSAKVRMEQNKYICSLCHTSTHEIIPNTSFAWYLREEKLEIQFWLSWSNYTAMDASFTRQKDKLVGSIFVDMSSFSHSPYIQKVSSGQYPLFNANCDSICNATARISIAFNTKISKEESEGFPSRYDDNSADESCISTNDDENLLNDICVKKIDEDEHESEDDDCEKVNIHIEEAMHLPTYFERNIPTHPNIYVTYQLPNSHLIYTHTSKDEGKHKWSFQKQHKMNIDTLKERRLIFHVWRCGGEKQNIDGDILIGTAELDTGPLFVGMKQILGWYNIQDLNRQVVGQIKLGVLPSTTFSPSKSIKYFRSNQPMQPINLTTTNFSNPMLSAIPKMGSEVFDTSPKVLLFQKLNTQLQDLQELTNRIQQRVYKSPHSSTHQSSSNIISEKEITYNHDNDNVNSKDASRNAESKESKTEEESSISNVCEEHTNEVVGEVETSKCVDHPLHSTTSLVRNVLNTDIEQSPECKTLPTTSNVSGHCFRNDGHFEEFNEEAEVTEIADDGNSSCDSTDELLDDLKQFEKKFTFIKGTLEKDNNYEQDSWISDTEIIDINLNQAEISNVVNSLDTRKINEAECIVSNTVNKCCDEAVEEKGDRDFQIDDDLVVNISSTSDPSKENVVNHVSNEPAIMNSPDVFTEDITNLFDEPKQTSECCHANQESALSDVEEDNMNPTTMEYHRELNFFSDEELGCSSETEIQPTCTLQNLESRKDVNLPNFFMRPEELAESMQALRMSAKLRHSPRTRSSCSGDDDSHVKPNTDVIYLRNGDKQLKEKIRKTLPVEASEMARIASIFALKSQRK